MILRASLLVLPLGILLEIIAPVNSAIQSLQPNERPLSTPYRNEKPVVYLRAFYDPRFHDDGRHSRFSTHRKSKLIPKTTVIAPSIRSNSVSKNIGKHQNSIKEKSKRGAIKITPLQRRRSDDSLAMESSQSPHVTFGPSFRVSVPIKPDTQDQIASETKQVRPAKKDSKVAATSTSSNSFNPNVAGSYYDNQNTIDISGYVNRIKDDLVNGRRKLKGYYISPNYSPSLGKAVFEMESHIGYW